MPSVRKKQWSDINVYDAAITRINQLYDQFDNVVVSFSGGKDSTVCLQLCLQVARKRKRLPLRVHFWDEEAIYAPHTIDYVERVANMPGVELMWLCLPIIHRNACSRTEPYWYCWDPEKKDLWCRDVPKYGIFELPGFIRGMSLPDAAHLPYGPEYGVTADIRGLRADESLRRYRAVMNRSKDNWIGGSKTAPNFYTIENKPDWLNNLTYDKQKTIRINHNYPVSPIYDWTTIDVWLAPKKFGWDYNRAYDVMDKAGISPHWQRVCPPFGEEPIRSLWVYMVGWPELWAKMTKRVPGAATAARYALTQLYGFGKVELPRGMSWQTWTFQLLDLYPSKYKKIIARNIRNTMEGHSDKTKRPLHDTEPDPVTGLSWRYICMLVNRGDLKHRRAGNATSVSRTDTRGVKTLEELMDADGTRY